MTFRHVANVRSLLVLAGLAAAVVVALTLSAGAAQDESVPPAVRPSDSCKAVVPGDLDAGPSLAGLQRVRSEHCDAAQAALSATLAPPPTRLNAIVSSYGSCAPTGSDGGGCGAPVEVQTWRRCERNYSLYERYAGRDGPPPHVLTRIRGVPAALFDDGRRIELYTADATVVIFAQEAKLASRAAASLRGSVGSGVMVDVGDDLPDPAAGALEGRLPCQDMR